MRINYIVFSACNTNLCGYLQLLRSLEAGKWLPEEEYELTEFSRAVQVNTLINNETEHVFLFVGKHISSLYLLCLGKFIITTAVLSESRVSIPFIWQQINDRKG